MHLYLQASYQTLTRPALSVVRAKVSCRAKCLTNKAPGSTDESESMEHSG